MAKKPAYVALGLTGQVRFRDKVFRFFGFPVGRALILEVEERICLASNTLPRPVYTHWRKAYSADALRLDHSVSAPLGCCAVIVSDFYPYDSISCEHRHNPDDCPVCGTRK